MPKFSVIVPLYNKAPYVRKALDSIMSQTYRDFECVVIDDGSTDNSLVDVNEYIRDVSCMMYDVCEKIKVISQANSGVAAARNNGVAASHGEFVCFLDADDWWEPNYLEEMDRLIAEYPDAGLYATNYVYYKPGKTHVALKLETGYINYPEAYLQNIAMPVCTGAACMPREVFGEMGGFPEGIKIGEDFLLWAKTALHYPIAFCEKPLAYYNNDVPASQRATRNLHEPKRHMLFNLLLLEEEIEKSCVTDGRYIDNRWTPSKEDWKALLDWLRVNGLMEYWLSDKYHETAAEELKKVDWSKQPRSAKAVYEKPIGLLRAKRRMLQIGSLVKQRIMKRIH